MYLQKLCSFVTIRSRWATFQGLGKNRITMLNVYLNLLHKQQESKIFYEAEIFKRRTQRFVWLEGVRLLHTRTTSGQTTTEICPAATSFPFSFDLIGARYRCEPQHLGCFCHETGCSWKSFSPYAVCCLYYKKLFDFTFLSRRPDLDMLYLSIFGNE